MILEGHLVSVGGELSSDFLSTNNVLFTEEENKFSRRGKDNGGVQINKLLFYCCSSSGKSFVERIEQQNDGNRKFASKYEFVRAAGQSHTNMFLSSRHQISWIYC